MTKPFTLPIRQLAILAMLIAAGIPRAAWAQDPPAGTPRDDPFELPDPAIEAIVASDPQTPAEILQATLTLTDLGRPKLGRLMFGKLLRLKLKDDALADLAAQVGSDKLFRITELRDLGDEARKFAGAALAAADKRAREPGRQTKLIELLNSDSIETRRSALVDLKAGREAAVAALLSALSDNARTNEHANLSSALLALSPISAGPIFGALETGDPGFKSRVIELVPHVQIPGAPYYLIAPALDPTHPEIQSAARDALLQIVGKTPPSTRITESLDRHIAHLINSPAPLKADHQGLVSLWIWDDGNRTIAEQEFSVEEAGVLLAARIARDLLRLPMEFGGDRRTALAVLLEADRHKAGFGKPLPAGASDASSLVAEQAVHDIEAFLDRSLQLNLLGAAAEAIRLLGETDSQEILQSSDGRPTLLARTLTHADSRVRFAAALAVTRLAPATPFAGSSELVPALGDFVKGAGKPYALVADARIDHALNVAALLAANGYRTDAAATGQELLRLAEAHGDVEAVFLSTTLNNHDVRETLFRLRRKAGGAQTPVAIISSLEERPRADQIAADAPGTLAFIEPQDESAAKYYLEALARLRGRRAPSPDERLEMARRSLRMLQAVAEDSSRLSEIRRHELAIERAAHVAAFGETPFKLLVTLGTPSSQTALAALAARSGVPMPARRLAAAAFAESIGQHGILQTTRQIVLLYDRYNASETAGPEVQQLLASLLDAIEAPQLAKRINPPTQ